MEDNNVSKASNIFKLILSLASLIGFGMIFYLIISFFFFKEPYEEYESCGTDKEKWQICINSLVDAAVEDYKDGVWDDKYFTWEERLNYINLFLKDKIVDENLYKEVRRMEKDKLLNLGKEYPNIKDVQNKVIEKFGQTEEFLEEYF